MPSQSPRDSRNGRTNRSSNTSHSARNGRTRNSGGSTRRRRQVSPQQQQVYRRRRVMVVIGVLAFVALSIFSIYSLIRGAIGAHDWIGVSDRMAISRSAAAPTPVKQSKVRECNTNDIEMDLIPSTQSTGVGGSITFTAKITYTGKDPEGCFVNGSDDMRVLQISSGNTVIWRSDACETAYRPLLMMSGESDEQTMTWNADKSGSSCVADDQLPRVERGTYTAQLILKDNPKVVSKPVTVTVE